jgi:hypothetical protein
MKGGFHMRVVITPLLFIFLIVLRMSLPSFAAVEISEQKTLDLEKSPLDVAVSLNGKWIFVLTDQQKILIFSSDGALNDEIPVDARVDGIQVGGREDIIYLTSRSQTKIQILKLDFIYKINVLGSAFKGKREAPVVIAIFSEFE